MNSLGNQRLLRPGLIFVLLCSAAVSGCNQSFHDMGKPPRLSKVNEKIPIESVLLTDEPKVIRGPDRVSMSDNTLWNKRDSIYFRDTRAYEIGDILTVNISMNDSAKFKNKSKRDGSLSGSLAGSGTYTLPSGINPTATLDGSLKSKLGAEQDGSVNRSERINLHIAAVVVDASNNGNLQISGSQEVRVNHEIRILTVAGVVRSRDILPNNTIPYELIAEARISYGGHNTRPRKSPAPTTIAYN